MRHSDLAAHQCRACLYTSCQDHWSLDAVPCQHCHQTQLAPTVLPRATTHLLTWVQQVHKASCVIQCLDSGICKGGFCHCRKGFWGKDCSSSKVYAPHAARRPVHKLRVYVYDLPWTVSTLLLLLCCRT